MARMEGFTMRTIWQIGMATLAAAGLLLAQATRTAELDLKAAQHTAEVEGDLDGAIRAYGAIVARYAKTDRAAAAEALLHMADCYQKMGAAEARKFYEQVVREYADQKDTAALARARLSGANSQKVITLKQVWSGPKVDVYGSVSLDGRYLSFVDWANHGNLGLHDLVTGDDRLIATGGESEFSSISRDGKMVAYAWYKPDVRRYEIRLGSLSGDAKPRILYDNEEVLEIAPYDWSPDGKWIAATLWRKDRTAQLGLISAHDGSLRVLKSINWSGPTRMFFSPDGRFLAYDVLAGDAADQRDVFVLAADGSREMAAVSSPNQDIVMGWSPDGRYLLFSSDRTGSMGLWAVPMHDGRPQGQPELLKANIGIFESSMGVTASGTLYFGRTGRSRNIEIVPVDWTSGKLSGPAANPVQRFVGSNSFPSWSANGKYLSCISMRDPSGANKILVTVAADTGQVLREVRPKMNLATAEMAADGRSFTAQGRDLKGRQGIFRVDAASGEVTPLVIAEETPAGEVVFPVGSADEMSVFFVKLSRDPQGRRGPFALFEKDLASGSERQIARGENLVSQIRLSPDRQWIAASTADPATKTARVLLIPVRGGEPRELLRAGAPAQFRLPGWTPDGRSVVVWKSLTGDWQKAKTASEVWRVPIEGREPHRLELDLASLPAANGFQFSPDGRYIAYDTNSGSLSEVSVLENFLPTPTKAK